MLSYDPEDSPKFDEEACEQATDLGLWPIHILCDVPEEDADDYTKVIFTAYVAFIPRVGERIGLEDGTMCEVTRVYYKVKKPGKYISLVPHLYAVPLAKSHDEDD